MSICFVTLLMSTGVVVDPLVIDWMLIVTGPAAGSVVTVTAAAPRAVASAVDAAVIVVTPSDTAVTTPFASIVATPEFDDAHVTVRAVPSAPPLTVATNWAVWPTVSERLAGVTTTAIGSGGGVGMTTSV
jgi:hypothetical protein